MHLHWRFTIKRLLEWRIQMPQMHWTNDNNVRLTCRLLQFYKLALFYDTSEIKKKKTCSFAWSSWYATLRIKTLFDSMDMTLTLKWIILRCHCCFFAFSKCSLVLIWIQFLQVNQFYTMINVARAFVASTHWFYNYFNFVLILFDF